MHGINSIDTLLFKFYSPSICNASNSNYKGQCGSCWAFASMATLESQIAIANGGKLYSLSEQQCMDCAGLYGSGSCNGGWPEAVSWGRGINKTKGNKCFIFIFGFWGKHFCHQMSVIFVDYTTSKNNFYAFWLA